MKLCCSFVFVLSDDKKLFCHKNIMKMFKSSTPFRRKGSLWSFSSPRSYSSNNASLASSPLRTSIVFFFALVFHCQFASYCTCLQYVSGSQHHSSSPPVSYSTASYSSSIYPSTSSSHSAPLSASTYLSFNPSSDHYSNRRLAPSLLHSRRKRSKNSTLNYNILVLMVERSATNRFDLVHIGPAIDIAVEKCRTELGVHLNAIKGTYGDQCSETSSLGYFADRFNSTNIVSLIGPACSDDVRIVGRLASSRRIPLLTGLGDVIDTRDRPSFLTLIRTSYDLRDKAKAILAFLKHHDWFTFGLIFRYQDVYYQSLAEELLILVNNRNNQTNQEFNCACRESYIRDESKVITTPLDPIMRRIKACSRIVVIIGGEKEVRKMMLLAYSLGMTHGDYAFIYTELIEKEAVGNTSWAGGNESPSTKKALKEAYQSLMIVSLNQPPGEFYKNFSDSVKVLAMERYNYTYNEQVANYFTASFHDSVLLLCRALKDNAQKDPSFAQLNIPEARMRAFESMKNITFSGISGNVTIDSEGDRIADYALLDQINPKTGMFEVAVRYFGNNRKYEKIRDIHWPNGKRPKDTPECGFDGSQCKKYTVWEITIVIMITLFFFLIIIMIIFFKRVKYNAKLTNMSWRIRWEDIKEAVMDSPIHCGNKNNGVVKSAFCKDNFASHHPGPHGSLKGSLKNINLLKFGREPFITGFYRGNQVVIKKLAISKLDVTADLLTELKIMKETSHENLTRFIGLCCEDCPAIVTEYCTKGSLKELLANSSLNLDWLFRCSMINDIIAGMTYLHNSEHTFHGRLNSQNCLVDSRFCLKISDFGLRKLKQESGYFHNCNSSEELAGDKHSRKCQLNCDTDRSDKLLYIAPEFFFHCKCKSHPEGFCTRINSGSQKGDVYSFAVILQEIILRSEPYFPYSASMELSDIIRLIKFDNLRPIVPTDSCIPELQTFLGRCWSTNPDERLDFALMRYEMKNIHKCLGLQQPSLSSSLTENLLIRMEQYATDLEGIVRQRTYELAEEKKKTEELLYQILPKPVAEQLRLGKMFEPNFYDSVTIYFSDIVGFTHLCSKSTPMQVIDFLNDLYTFFDSIIRDFDVYKVETIGDSYMVVSGLPERNGIEHARQICRMALRMVELLDNFKIKHQPDERLQLRIGINTGPTCAGCVGNIRPRFCLFGDAVNTASRMESNGEPSRIHVSSSTKVVLDLFGTFVLEPRGEVSIKGKGKMLTYWLLREDENKKTLLAERQRSLPLTNDSRTATGSGRVEQEDCAGLT